MTWAQNVLDHYQNEHSCNMMEEMDIGLKALNASVLVPGTTEVLRGPMSMS